MKTTNIFALIIAGILTLSCAENKKEASVESVANETSTIETTKYAAVSNSVLEDYMELKNALVDTDQEKASAAGEKLVTSLKEYNLEDQTTKLSASIISATEHAEGIVDSNIEEQREHFYSLSSAMMDIINMTGTDAKLYQQYCPMYGEAGGTWLSSEEKIRNPYFGDKMMNCGEVQKEIN